MGRSRRFLSFARRSGTATTLVRLVAALILALASSLPRLLMAPPAEAATLGAPIDPALSQAMAKNPAARQPIIVEMQHGSPVLGADVQLAQQALSLLQLHGIADVALPLVDGAAGLADAAEITALSLLPGVEYIAQDAEVHAHVDPSQLGTAYPIAVDASQVWAAGGTGAGVTVAVLDSGILPDPDLTQPANRILARANFADPLGGSTDPGGHGTHVAGTIAGNGTRSRGQFVGVAPAANLVDVRVLDGQGRGRMSSVILGIQWTLDHQAQYGIRVLNLSLGAPAPANPRLDPLAAAAELAWMHGLVVVTASGNTPGSVDSPGTDPYVITVGATDDQGTPSVSDDVEGWFSGWGTPAGSVPKPDLVAPGRKIVSIRAPGSSLDQLLPDHVVTARDGASYFRLTGTSMSTAVVSGVVALLLERQPHLTPDQVKAVLTGTTRAFGQTSGITPAPATIGSGLIDANAAVTSGPRGSANRGLQPTDIAASTLYPAIYGQPLHWKNSLLGGVLWTLLNWTTLDWNNLAWDNLAWDTTAWDNLAWDNLAWDNLAWDSTRWNNLAWDNLAWDSQRLD
jgi:serine protease AprX